MKKKALLLASIGVLVCTVGITALAVGGANQLDAFAVKADPTEYSITFDASDESTTVEAVDGDYAIYTTTPRGAKVGAYQFSTITGFEISFSGGLGVAYESGKTSLGGELITSGKKYDVSITPSDTPQFYAGGNVTVSSLTIYYTC